MEGALARVRAAGSLEILLPLPLEAPRWRLSVFGDVFPRLALRFGEATVFPLTPSLHRKEKLNSTQKRIVIAVLLKRYLTL